MLVRDEAGEANAFRFGRELACAVFGNTLRRAVWARDVGYHEELVEALFKDAPAVGGNEMFCLIESGRG